MKKLVVNALLCAFVIIPSNAMAESQNKTFSYNNETGQCVDRNGKLGYNPVSPAYLFSGKQVVDNSEVYEGKNAECVDFADFDFGKYVGLGYPKLLRWNMAGANFHNALFVFADIKEANLRGADLKNLEFGYATIHGTIDKYTKIPTAENSECIEKNAELRCRR